MSAILGTLGATAILLLALFGFLMFLTTGDAAYFALVIPLAFIMS